MNCIHGIRLDKECIHCINGTEPRNVSASGSNELLCDLDAEFKKNTKHKVTIYGFEINCKKGLWGVCAPTEKQALNEAKYYFRQYFEDGEYT